MSELTFDDAVRVLSTYKGWTRGTMMQVHLPRVYTEQQHRTMHGLSVADRRLVPLEERLPRELLHLCHSIDPAGGPGASSNGDSFVTASAWLVASIVALWYSGNPTWSAPTQGSLLERAAVRLARSSVRLDNVLFGGHFAIELVDPLTPNWSVDPACVATAGALTAALTLSAEQELDPLGRPWSVRNAPTFAALLLALETQG